METSEEKNNSKRQRINVITFGILALLSLVYLVYAFVQQGIAKESQKLAASQHEELIKCRQELEHQKKIAEMNAMEVELQHQRAEEALKKTSKK
jgi:hypothetical protein